MSGSAADEGAAAGAETLDLRGLLCPLPVLKTRRRLAGRPAGTRIVVLATDPMAAIDIPHHCAEAGHLLLGQRRRDDGVLEFEIERGA